MVKSCKKNESVKGVFEERATQKNAKKHDFFCQTHPLQNT